MAYRNDVLYVWRLENGIHWSGQRIDSTGLEGLRAGPKLAFIF